MTSGCGRCRLQRMLVGIWPNARTSRAVGGGPGSHARSAAERLTYCRIGSGPGCRWLAFDVEVRDE